MSIPTEESIKEWFNKKYLTEGQKSMRPYPAYAIFCDLLEGKNGEKLLDVGCGPGWILKAANQYGLESYGIDLSLEALKLAKSNVPDSNLLLSSVQLMTFPDNFFNYVTCIGVLEHFVDLKKSISEMQRVAKENATYCIMVPNSQTLYWQFLGRWRSENSRSNENAYPLHRWSELFKNYHFEILDVKRDDWWLKKVSRFIGFKGKPFSWIKNISELLIPLRFAHQFIFLLRKNSSLTASNRV